MFAIVGTETTYLGPIAGIVKLDVVFLNAKFKELSRWSTLINPENTIPNANIHGITDDMVTDAPTFREICGELLDLLDGRIVLVDNANFDAGMIANECDWLTDLDTTVFFHVRRHDQPG
ncbi:3'-5' exonuclease [Corynebacterium anserum]|uniref:3'-5' exonuclease n=1 Tax=Corynebacterium anserum TaxID=2684406 RepID=UPI00163A8DF5|nr:3'-5' exonuclease [Corynebacterium anserum]MBC2681986.1 hypothetical protein [Corynebacterium anserum]